MNDENGTSKEIPLGTPVLYYNQWTGLDTKILASQFYQLNIEETRNLEVGNVIYIDVDRIHKVKCMAGSRCKFQP